MDDFFNKDEEYGTCFFEWKKFIGLIVFREPEEITKFIAVASVYNINCYSLLVSRPNAQTWFNMADDGVNNAEYDLYYYNNKSLEELPNHFLEFLEKSLKE